MKLSELRKRFEDVMKAKREKMAEIDRLKAELAETEKEMLASADRGDLNKYMELDNKKRGLEARIFVYERSLPNAGNPLTREEVIKAWSSFTAQYNKDAEKQYKAFLSDCKELCNKYKSLVSVQNSALMEREKALEIMGEKRTSDALSMYMIPVGSNSADDSEKASRWSRSTSVLEIPFFIGMGILTSEEAEKIDQIVESGFYYADEK